MINTFSLRLSQIHTLTYLLLILSRSLLTEGGDCLRDQLVVQGSVGATVLSLVESILDVHTGGIADAVYPPGWRSTPTSLTIHATFHTF